MATEPAAADAAVDVGRLRPASGTSDIPTRDRLPSLTALRFWAAALVVVYHLSRQLAKIPVISDVGWYGRTGVTFFFVLSGFVLAWTYHDAPVRPAVFWWRRFARIWPMLLVATLLSTAVYLAMGVDVPPRAVAAALAMVHAWSFDPVVVRGGNGATWSLSDEAFFYLLFPLVLPLVRRLRVRGQLLVAALAVVVLLVGWVVLTREVPLAHRALVIDYWPVSRLPQFVAGVALGCAVRGGWRPRVRLDVAVAAVLAFHVALFAWGHVTTSTQWTPYSASQVMATPFFAAVVVAAACRDLAGRTGWLGHPWALRLGHWSFAWYLVHEIFLRVWVYVLGHPAGLAHAAGTWAVIAATSLVAAGLLYRLVEHPAERRLRAFVDSR